MKKWWLYLIFLLSFVSIASAQYYYTDGGWGLGGFGFGDIVGFYQSNPYLFDFFISLVIFISLGKIVFGGEAYRRGSKGLTIGMSLALSFALILWESRTGFNLGDIWIFALLILILAVIIAIYSKFKGTGYGLSTMMIIMFIVGLPAWYFLEDYIYYLPDSIANIIYFLIWFMVVISVIYIFVLILGWILGKTGGGLPPEPSDRDYLGRGGGAIGRGLLGGGRLAGRGVRGISRAVARRLSARQALIHRYDSLIRETQRRANRATTAERKERYTRLIPKLRARRENELEKLRHERNLGMRQIQQAQQQVQQQTVQRVQHVRQARQVTKTRLMRKYKELIADNPKLFKKMREAARKYGKGSVQYRKFYDLWSYGRKRVMKIEKDLERLGYKV